MHRSYLCFEENMCNIWSVMGQFTTNNSHFIINKNNRNKSDSKLKSKLGNLVITVQPEGDINIYTKVYGNR